MAWAYVSPILLTALLLVGACEAPDAGTSPPPNPAPDQVSVDEMPGFCRGAAAEQFGQSPRDISTRPAISDQRMYSVFGQYPPSGADPTVFICTFTQDGELVGVDLE